MATALLTLWAIAASVILVDPYGVYPWGARLPVEPGEYRPAGRPWVLNAALQEGYDTVLIGGSTADQYDSAALKAAFPDAERAFASSWAGPGPKDLLLVLDRIAETSTVRRVVISFDSSWLARPEVVNPVFPVELYDADPTNDLNVITPDTLILMAGLGRGRYFAPSWDPSAPRALLVQKMRNGQSPGRRRFYQRFLDDYRHRVDAPTVRTCDDYPSLNLLGRAARKLRARGKAVDIVIPPYSYMTYYDHMQAERIWRYGGEAPLGVLIQQRRCLVALLGDDIPVHAFDLEAWLVEDMAHYRDSTHLHGRGIGAWLLAAVARGDHRLTAAEFEPYATELRRRVQTYRLRNSKAGW